MPITILQISIGSNHSTMETIMTSTTIYTPISPTYLYIKQHSITKKKYFGKTTNPNPIKYLGSGKYWLRHIKKHGIQFVETIWISDLYYDTSIREPALHFSCENKIDTTPTIWANLEPEDGLSGGVAGTKQSAETISKRTGKKRNPHSQESKDKMSAARTGKKLGPHSQETKDKISASNKGRILSEESKDKISASLTGRLRSDETKSKISAANKGKILSEETKAKLSAANKGKKRSAESRDKMRVSQTGKKKGPRSQETKDKISATLIAKRLINNPLE